MTLSLSLATFFRPNSLFTFYSLQHQVHKYLLIMLLRFDKMLYSNLGNENSGGGQSNVHGGRIWPVGRRFPTSGPTGTQLVGLADLVRAVSVWGHFDQTMKSCRNLTC